MDNAGLPDSELASLQVSMAQAYNLVASCDMKGSFRFVNQARTNSVNLGGSTTSTIEYIVAFSGSCEGCSEDRLELFNDTIVGDEGDRKLISSSESANQFPSMPRRRRGESRAEVEKLCACMAPSRLSFVDEINAMLQSNSVFEVLDVTELDTSEKCVDLMFNTSDYELNMKSSTTSPTNFTSTVSVTFFGEVTGTDGNEVKALETAFRDAFHSEMRLTNGACDVYKRVITEVEAQVRVYPARGIRGTPVSSHAPSLVAGDRRQH